VLQGFGWVVLGFAPFGEYWVIISAYLKAVAWYKRPDIAGKNIANPTALLFKRNSNAAFI